jgi:hypothetical protein
MGDSQVALYTFYLCKIDGSSSSFEMWEAASDKEARPVAQRMLAEHLSCDYVAVWADQRPVCVQPRRPQGRNLYTPADRAVSGG